MTTTPTTTVSPATRLNPAQRAIATATTPANLIRSRVGRAGRTFQYISVQDVEKILNSAYSMRWSFEIISKELTSKYAFVHGRLTVYPKDAPALVKEQFGGAEVKVNSKTGELLSPADDLKAAASNALKRCAEMLNIGIDLKNS